MHFSISTVAETLSHILLEAFNALSFFNKGQFIYVITSLTHKATFLLKWQRFLTDFPFVQELLSYFLIGGVDLKPLLWRMLTFGLQKKLILS